MKERNVSEDEGFDDEFEYESGDDEGEDEEAWGSASPETRVKPNRSKKRCSLNPLSLLQRLTLLPKP